MRGYDVRPDDAELGRIVLRRHQQKLVLARSGARPDLLAVGQPTRGVDIGAIEFIHRRLDRDARPGQGRLLLGLSVELDQIMSLADRILVMFDGTITGSLLATSPTSADRPAHGRRHRGSAA